MLGRASRNSLIISAKVWEISARAAPPIELAGEKACHRVLPDRAANRETREPIVRGRQLQPLADAIYGQAAAKH
jgi:hypothetical protein